MQFQLAELSKKIDLLPPIPDPQNRAVLEVKGRFLENINRAKTLIWALPAAFLWGFDYLDSMQTAYKAVYGPNWPTPQELADPEKFALRQRLQVEDFFKRQNERSNHPAEKKKDAFNFSFQDSEAILKVQNIQTLDSLLASTVILAWSSFETLAGELWEAAVNESPRTLGHNAIMKGKTSDPTASKNSRDRILDMVLDALKHNQYDLSKSLGKVLRGNYDFAGRTKIIASYSTVFGKPHAKNLANLISVPDIIVVSQFRNVLVHHGGKVSDECEKQIAMDSRFPGLKAGQNLPLTSDTVGICISGVWNCGASLVKFVDDWLK